EGCDRGHVSIVAQNAPAFDETARRESKRRLERIEHLGAARMTSESAEIAEFEFILPKEVVQDIPEVIRNERWNALRKDRLETVLLDLPSHDVERIGPSMLPRCAQRSSLAFRRDKSSGGAVAEKRCCDDVALRKIVLAEGQRTQLHHKKKHA